MVPTVWIDIKAFDLTQFPFSFSRVPSFMFWLIYLFGMKISLGTTTSTL